MLVTRDWRSVPHSGCSVTIDQMSPTFFSYNFVANFRQNSFLGINFQTNQSQSVQNVDLIPSKEYKDSAHKTFITELKLFN